MPSPVCKERVGEKVGKVVVDKFGDNVTSQHLLGDPDKIKMKSITSAAGQEFQQQWKYEDCSLT